MRITVVPKKSKTVKKPGNDPPRTLEYIKFLRSLVHVLLTKIKYEMKDYFHSKIF